MTYRNKHTGELVPSMVVQWAKDNGNSSIVSQRVHATAQFILDQVVEDWEVEVGQVFERTAGNHPRTTFEVVKVHGNKVWTWSPPRGSMVAYADSFNTEDIKRFVEDGRWKMVNDKRDDDWREGVEY